MRASLTSRAFMGWLYYTYIWVRFKNFPPLVDFSLLKTPSRHVMGTYCMLHVWILIGLQYQHSTGPGCGPGLYYCWKGNICLPTSLPCNGYCPALHRSTPLTAFLNAIIRRDSGLILRCISSPAPPLAPLLSSSSIPQNTSLTPLLTLLLLSITLLPTLFVYLKRRKIASIELEDVEVLEENIFSPGFGIADDIKRYEVVRGRTPIEGEHVISSNAFYKEGRMLWLVATVHWHW